MKPIRAFLDKVRPNFEPGGRMSALGSVYEGFESFLYTPRTTSAPTLATHIHDAIDSKRAMIIVVLALMPCFFFGMYNTDTSIGWRRTEHIPLLVAHVLWPAGNTAQGGCHISCGTGDRVCSRTGKKRRDSGRISCNRYSDTNDMSGGDSAVDVGRSHCFCSNLCKRSIRRHRI